MPTRKGFLFRDECPLIYPFNRNFSLFFYIKGNKSTFLIESKSQGGYGSLSQGLWKGRNRKFFFKILFINNGKLSFIT